MWKKIVLAFASIAVVSLISACNTVEGAGKDVSAGGKKVQEEANQAKQKMYASVSSRLAGAARRPDDRI